MKNRRRRLYVLAAGRCRYCGERISYEDTTLDHIVPKSKGGRTTDTNLAIACWPCNLAKGDRDEDDPIVIALRKSRS